MQDQLFFRVRDNGTAVFRVSEDQHSHRLELTQIAVLKENGAIKAHQKHVLSDLERSEIETWHSAQPKTPESEMEVHCRNLNRAAQWVQAQANDDELREGQSRMLMSIHDLRRILVRRLSKLTN